MTLVTLGIVLSVTFLLVNNAENAAFADASSEALHSLGQFYADKVDLYDAVRADVLTESLPLSLTTVDTVPVGAVLPSNDSLHRVISLLYPAFRLSHWMLAFEMVLPDGEYVRVTAESDPDIHSLLITHVRRIANATVGSATVLFERRIVQQDYTDPVPTLEVISQWEPDASVSLSIDLEHPWHPYANLTRASTDPNWKWEMASDVSAKAAYIYDDDDDVVVHVEQFRFSWFAPDHVQQTSVQGEFSVFAMNLVFRVDDPHVDNHFANFRVAIDLGGPEEILRRSQASYQEHVDLAVIEGTSGRVIHHTEPDYRLSTGGHDELKKLWELEGDFSAVTADIINAKAVGEVYAGSTVGERHDTGDLEVGIFHLPEVPTFELVIIANRN
jgi:hypothetical protein